MDWFLYICLAGTLILGLLLNLIGLPGLWLMLAAHAVYAWATWPRSAGWESLVALLVLALLAELAEFLAGAAGSKSAGGTLRSAAGAIVGGIVGGIAGQILIPIPIVGAVVGACVGSFIGAASLESTHVKADVETTTMHWNRARRVGWGAFKGRLLGIIVKSGIGIVMLIASLWTAWG
jgi:uncharacterized protein YqgC (DUF456 family)